MSLGNDCESEEDQLKNRYQFVCKGVVNTLTNPIKISTLPRKLDFELRFAKVKADTKLQSGLNNIFGYQIDKFSSVKSVFETAGFFTQILDSCKEQLTSVHLGNEKVREENATTSVCSTDRHDSSISRQVVDDCSIEHGHTSLPKYFNSATPSYLIFSKDKSYEELCDNECEYHLKSEERKFTSILTPPLTRGNYNTINVSKFLALSSLCRRCSSHIHSSDNTISKIDLRTSGIKWQSLLKFKKASELCQEEEKLRLGSNIEEMQLQENYESSINSELSSLGGVFKIFIRKKNVTSSKNLVHGQVATDGQCDSKKENLSASSIAFTDLPVFKKSVSKYRPVDCHSIGVDYPPRSGNLAVSVPSGLEPISPPNYVVAKVQQKKRLSTTSPGKEGKSKKKRKVYVRLPTAKEIKKKKKKKIKKKSKLSINLSPPPGQNLDDYLQQQLLIIKAQLAAKKHVDPSSLADRESRKSLKPTLPKKEDPKALPLEYEQVNSILGDIRPADGIGEIVVYNEEVLLKSPKIDSDKSLHLHNTTFSPEKYAYPAIEKRNLSKNVGYVSPTEGSYGRKLRDDISNDKGHRYRYRRSMSPIPRSSHSPGLQLAYPSDRPYYTHRSRSKRGSSPSPVSERKGRSPYGDGNYFTNDRSSPRRHYSPHSLRRKPSRSPVSERRGHHLSPTSRSKPRSSRSPRPRSSRPTVKRKEKSINISKSKQKDLVSERKVARESVRNQNGFSETQRISFSIKRSQEGSKLPREPPVPGTSTDDECVQSSADYKRPSKNNIKITEVKNDENPTENGNFTKASSPIIELPSSPCFHSGKVAVVAKNDSESLVSEGEFTLSDDSNSEGPKAPTINGIKQRRKSYREFRSRSMSVSPPGESRRELRYSRSRSPSYSPRRKKTSKAHVFPSPSPPNANKKYHYKTQVVEVKQTIGTASVGASSDNSAVQQLQTRTIYEYQTTAHVPYAQPLIPQVHPPMNYPYPQPQYSYYPPQPHMVPYQPPYTNPPYF